MLSFDGAVQASMGSLTNSFGVKHERSSSTGHPLVCFQGVGDQLIISRPRIQTIIPNAPAFDPKSADSIQTYQKLLREAQSLARPDVSGRRVGAIAIGGSGTAYFGANIEIKGGAPSDVIHAEASAFALAKANGEARIVAMVQTLQPCGSCRQILAEGGNPKMPVHIVSPDGPATAKWVQTQTIEALYPYSYSYGTPSKNIFKPPVLQVPTLPGQIPHSELLLAARNAAQLSYLPNPFRKAWAGLAAQTGDGHIFTGRVITVAGPNPTITPIQDLLVQMTVSQRSPEELTEAVLVEPKDPDYSFYKGSKSVFKLISPGLKCQRMTL